MNRKSRRALQFGRTARPAEVTTTNKPPRNTTLTEPLKRKALPQGIRTAPKQVWAVIAAISTGVSLLGLLVLRPAVLIEPYGSTNNTLPFAQQFSVENTSAYAIHNVRPACNFGNDSNLPVRGISFENADEFVDTLEPGAKTTLTCSVGTGPTTESFNVSPRADYTIPFGIPFCKSVKFRGKPVSGGSYLWTYNGSGSCPKRPPAKAPASR